jgi:hypothetical protein
MRSTSLNPALSSSPGTGPASSASSPSVAGWTAAGPNATAAPLSSSAGTAWTKVTRSAGAAGPPWLMTQRSRDTCSSTGGRLGFPGGALGSCRSTGWVMSEYQYYEFLAGRRPAARYVRAIQTRRHEASEPTSHRPGHTMGCRPSDLIDIQQVRSVQRPAASGFSQRQRPRRPHRGRPWVAQELNDRPHKRLGFCKPIEQI